MKHIVFGQTLMILCCIFYLIWWYRGFRPGVIISRVGGANGFLLTITVILGISGIISSLMPTPSIRKVMISQSLIGMSGIILYFLLLFFTKVMFHSIIFEVRMI